MITKEEALEYHLGGKVALEITKPCKTQKDLSLAYTPGVAEPCLEIEKDPSLAYKYTSKANTVAVISNGTAVLGLGNLGALASKPVMEGKGVLFKAFANVDSVDIEIDETDPEKIVQICAAIAPSWGGINLEDIKAPECFYIERELKKRTNIPVMHDDQHGTAIITTAGLLNAVEISGKDIEKMKIVVVGAGASATSCSKMYKAAGAKQVIITDSKGVISHTRTDLNDAKKELVAITDAQTLEEAMVGADMVLGLSVAGSISKEMIASMAPNPIIFTLSNPTPEIMPSEVKEVRDDAIIATGRSDFPNQVNNVLGFPFIFRGALDVQSTNITENMKMAAAKSLAALAKEEVPQYVKDAYNGEDLKFGKDYIIPKPFDRRVLVWESVAVAKAAIEDGVAGIQNFDLEAYKKSLEEQI
jgi:malate dehydrogenase (oxaloacetate-decarboxylating)(NADP+)